jgi:hypothetical protein
MRVVVDARGSALADVCSQTRRFLPSPFHVRSTPGDAANARGHASAAVPRSPGEDAHAAARARGVHMAAKRKKATRKKAAKKTRKKAARRKKK